MSITVNLETGNLEKVYDGHYYNNHTLDYERVESVNSSSDMVEMNVSCYRCGQHEQARVHTESEPHIWAIYRYLVGKFDEPCDQPQRRAERAAKRVINKHQGEAVDDTLIIEMKKEVRDRIDRPNAKINFI